MGRHGNGVRQRIEAVPVILRSLPPNMRLKLTALLFKGTVMLPHIRHVRRSLSAIR
jgi:hypothetical protein